jgi:hypothetical protein
MELASCRQSGAYNIDVTPGFLERFWTPVEDRGQYINLWMWRQYICMQITLQCLNIPGNYRESLTTSSHNFFPLQNSSKSVTAFV